MKNLKFIKSLPFIIEFKKGDVKEFIFTDSFKKFTISYNPNIQIKTTLTNGFGDIFSDFIKSGTTINKNRFTTIIFNKAVADIIITLSN